MSLRVCLHSAACVRRILFSCNEIKTYHYRPKYANSWTRVAKQGMVKRWATTLPSADLDHEASTTDQSTSDKNVDAPSNPVGVQLLERQVHRQLFPPTSMQIPVVDEPALNVCQDHLRRHDLHASKASHLRPTSFVLPPLQGKDLGEHFWTIGRQSVHPWLEYAERLSTAQIPAPPVAETDVDTSKHWDPQSWLALDDTLRASVPLKPATFCTAHGWTKYPFLRTSEGEIAGFGEPVQVPYPDEQDSALVFDVEVLVKVSPYPVMAVAVGQHAWYSWLSPWLVQQGPRHQSPAHLIPMGPRKTSASVPRLVVAHNAGFDRACVLDEYSLHASKIRWLDTMSLHVATNGISSPQRAAWTEHTRVRAIRRLNKLFAAQRVEEDTREQIRKLLGAGNLDDKALSELRMQQLNDIAEEVQECLSENIHGLNTSLGLDNPLLQTDDDHNQVLWQDVTSQNSLADVAALHCGIHVDKGIRDVFLSSTSREEVAAQLPLLLAYCASDVSTAFFVFTKVWPAFRRNCPHPATLAGVLGLGSTFLPLDATWTNYQQQAKAKFDEMNANVVTTLKKLTYDLVEAGIQDIDRACETSAKDRWWETDPWYSQLDWSPKRPKTLDASAFVPAWWRDRVANAKTKLSARVKIVPQLLQLQCDGNWVVMDGKRWAMQCGKDIVELPGSPLSQAVRKKHVITSGGGALAEKALNAVLMSSCDSDSIVRELALMIRDQGHRDQPGLTQLDWTPVPYHDPAAQAPWWPKWYWDLYDAQAQDVEVTIRTKIAPILLKIAWDGAPIFRSREHGWVYRRTHAHPGDATPLTFSHAADTALSQGIFYKLPHVNGDGSNVGNPFSKGFLPYFENGRLRSLHPSEQSAEAARAALEMNAQCSYWISARDRIEKQMVVWDGEADTCMGFDDTQMRRGMILPQVITMGTVTRRAIEKTWLTASNAKKNRIGSELKSMVKASPGWSIVGADVDSEELWICSVMGDAQFGIHGATAIGWMTLEGSKAQGTDLHSKTASILGTSRDQAKVFNYSRIYGAGIRHAMQLLLKANPSMPVDEASRRAKQLYAATKGQSTRSQKYFGRRFWYGGTESFVFNKLEEIALSEQPRTPALDCGITAALSKQFLPKTRGSAQQDYMPSRINWVVQSSGVDYLHLLITSMTHLCKTYDIEARFMLSVHDEVRYLARDSDKYRAALALQIANLWTRSMFAFKLNMGDVPESCAFFAAVDIDHVLRKEVDDPCVTPSQWEPIEPGESLDIHTILERTNGSLFRDGRPMPQPSSELHESPACTQDPGWPAYVPSTQQHRCLGEAGLLYLQAQASADIDEIRALHNRLQRRHARHPQPRRQRATLLHMPSVRTVTTSADKSAPAHQRLQQHSTRKTRQMESLLALEAMLPKKQSHRDPKRKKRKNQVRAPVSKSRSRGSPQPKSTRPMHLSGALLPPSLFNKPMLRYKPYQPAQMNMMISSRRRARNKRLQRWDEIQEIKFLAETEAQARVRDGFFDRVNEWCKSDTQLEWLTYRRAICAL